MEELSNNPELDNVMEENNMDGIENDDPTTYVNNMDDVHSNVNDDNINYLKEHMNIDNDTLDDIVAGNNVIDQGP